MENSEEELDRMIKVGESCGLKEASTYLMTLAHEEFSKQRDDQANAFRKAALYLQKLSADRHPGSRS